MGRLFLFFFLITVLFVDSLALVFRGKVTDENKNALPYATVRIKNKSMAVLGDSTGEFSISSEGLRDDDTLSVSYLGYMTLDIPLDEFTSGSNVRLELIPSPVRLEEVYARPSKVKIQILCCFPMMLWLR